jgi:aspartate beta-hydroxylase
LRSQPLWDPSQFWFVEYLEQNANEIRAELERVEDPRQHGFRPVDEPHKPYLYESGRWDQLIFYQDGRRYRQACEMFPVTAELLKAIPEATTETWGIAALSWLYPGTHILPHCGPTNARLRVHLGLKIPDGAKMRVKDVTFRWQEGKCIVLDDSYEHEVWHHGHEPRVVLLFDILNPRLSKRQKRLLLRRYRPPFEDRIRLFMAKNGVSRLEQDERTRDISFKPDQLTKAAIQALRKDELTEVEVEANGQVHIKLARNHVVEPGYD